MDDPNTTTTNDAGQNLQPPAADSTHGSPELDADAEKLKALGADPGATLADYPPEDEEEEQTPIAHNGPLTLSTEQHAEAKSLLADLEDHVPKEGHGLWRRLARLLRHA